MLSPLRENSRLFLFRCLLLGQLAGTYDLGRWRLIRSQAGNVCADLSLIVFVLWVLARRDEFGEPRRSLEKHDQEQGTCARPVVKRLACITAPLVKHKPDSLLCREVRVT